LQAKADQVLCCVKIGNATHANPTKASRTGIKKTAWSRSGGSPKTEITNASAVTLRTNAKSAVYGRVRSTIPNTSKTKKRSAARGKPHTTRKRKSVMIWSGFRFANVCCGRSDAVHASRLGNDSNTAATY